MKTPSENGKPFLVLLVAIVTLVLVSLLPLNRLSGGFLRNFSLFDEIMPTDTVGDEFEIVEVVDSSFFEEISIPADSDSVSVTTISQVIVDSAYIAVDTLINPRMGDIVVIEDYTGNGSALAHFKNALSMRDTLGRPVRIAMLGDSYIEGDIFSQHIREQLQDRYGGGGVGYVNMHSDFPGFRRSLRQSSSGWSVHDFVKNNVSSGLMTITQQYSVSRGVAKSTYRGTDYANNLDRWTQSRFVFMSNHQASVRLSTDNKTVAETFAAQPGELQCVEIADTTRAFKVDIDSDSLIGLGVWLENTPGITLDCMSTRGSSGITLARVNKMLSARFAAHIAYDLIILEFGMNAMTAGQKDFSGYIYTMEKVIMHLRQCYPDADILVMGIGDRASKRGTEVHSMTNVPLMVDAQRRLAQKCRCAFWDTREAMGGQDASVRWAEQKWVNKDYLHLSYLGGRKLADEFVKSLNHVLNE